MELRNKFREIAKKYENVRKGVADIMSGALIETEERTILNTGKQEGREETALRMLKAGKLPAEEIAEYSGLDIEQVEQLVRAVFVLI